MKLHEQYYVEKAKVEKLIAKKNQKSDFYNGIYDRYTDPVLTREHIPVEWKYDVNPETNPYFMERLGVNAVFNSGAIELNGKYFLNEHVSFNSKIVYSFVFNNKNQEGVFAHGIELSVGSELKLFK